MRQARPNPPQPPKEVPERSYRVLSDKCAWGAKGEIIRRRFTDAQERTVIASSLLEPVPDGMPVRVTPVPSSDAPAGLVDKPASGDTEGE